MSNRGDLLLASVKRTLRIYSPRMPRGMIYVIDSPDFVLAVQ